VYLHRGDQYLVDKMDLDKKDIIARKTDLRYFTRVTTEKETEIIRIDRSRPREQFLVREGLLRVTERVTGYEKRALPGQELMGTFSLDLPEQTFETVGFWIEFESVIKGLLDRQGLHFMGGIHAIEHGAIGMFPLFALCDRNDIGGICYTHHPDIGKPAIFIYDGYPGGVGLAQRGFEIVADLLSRTLNHIRNCPCEKGCPSCIHSPKCGSGNKPLDKTAAVMVLEFLLGHIPLSSLYNGATGDEPLPPPSTGAAPGDRKDTHRVVFLDLETRKLAQEVGGWQNIHLMGVSVAVLFDSLEDRFITYMESEIEGLIEHLLRADLVVGFNIKQFDYVVLGAYSNRSLRDLNTFDILEDIHRRLGFRLSLDHLAQETLDESKSGDGLLAVEWFRRGEMDKLIDYCSQDVKVTRDLFEYGLKNGYLVYRSKKENRRLKVRVDWCLEDFIQKTA
jgi:DEAD/DEAH box helicase domain-containing protein